MALIMEIANSILLIGGSQQKRSLWTAITNLIAATLLWRCFQFFPSAHPPNP